MLQRMKQLRYGLIILKEILSQLRPIMLLLGLLTTAMMENYCWLARMIRRSKFIALRIRNFISPWLVIKIGLKLPIFHQITDWSVLVVRTRLLFFGIPNLKKFYTNSTTISVQSMIVSSIQMELVLPVARLTKKWNFMIWDVRDWFKITMLMDRL